MFRPKSTFEQWRIFQAVVDCGGYAQAAEALNKSQSSLNHAVAKLQQSLGWPCWRCGDAGGADAGGEIFLKRARQLSQQVEELENLASNLERQWGRRSTSMCPWCSRGSASTGAGPTLSPQPRLPHQPARADHCHFNALRAGSDALQAPAPGSHRPAAGRSLSASSVRSRPPLAGAGEPITAEVLASHNKIKPIPPSTARWTGTIRTTPAGRRPLS